MIVERQLLMTFLKFGKVLCSKWNQISLITEDWRNWNHQDMMALFGSGIQQQQASGWVIITDLPSDAVILWKASRWLLYNLFVLNSILFFLSIWPILLFYWTINILASHWDLIMEPPMRWLEHMNAYLSFVLIIIIHLQIVFQHQKCENIMTVQHNLSSVHFIKFWRP